MQGDPVLQEMLKMIIRLREMSTYGNCNLQEERQSTRTGKYVDKHMTMYFFHLLIFKDIDNFLKQNDVLWDL